MTEDPYDQATKLYPALPLLVKLYGAVKGMFIFYEMDGPDAELGIPESVLRDTLREIDAVLKEPT